MIGSKLVHGVGYITKIEEVAGGDEALARVCEARPPQEGLNKDQYSGPICLRHHTPQIDLKMVLVIL